MLGFVREGDTIVTHSVDLEATSSSSTKTSALKTGERTSSSRSRDAGVIAVLHLLQQELRST